MENRLRARVGMPRLHPLQPREAAGITALKVPPVVARRPRQLRPRNPVSTQHARVSINPLAITTRSPPLLGEEHLTALFTKRRSLQQASTPISQQAMTMARTMMSYQLQVRAQASSSRGPAT